MPGHSSLGRPGRALRNGTLVRVHTGHDFHSRKPRRFIRLVDEIAARVK